MRVHPKNYFLQGDRVAVKNPSHDNWFFHNKEGIVSNINGRGVKVDITEDGLKAGIWFRYTELQLIDMDAPEVGQDDFETLFVFS